MEATLMAQGVDTWKSVAAPPWARIGYNLNVLKEKLSLACREGTKAHSLVASNSS
jgi:hypothetical protein